MSPLWLLFPGTLLTLLKLLAVPGSARADSAPAVARSFESSLTESKELLTAPDVDPRSCGRDQPSPTIAAITDSMRSYRLNNAVHLYPSFGDDITIFCSSNDASTLIIRDDDCQLQAEHLNSTTVQVTLIKPDVRPYIYHCTDSNTTCTDILRVSVWPAVSVMAPHVRARSRDKHGITDYFVTRGELYNVYCSAQQTSNLAVVDYFHDIKTKSVNATTLMATVTDHTEGGRLYNCKSSSSATVARVRITVDYYPEARDFRCILYRHLNLACWWMSTSKRNIFRLLILRNQESTLICLDNSRVHTAGCAGTLDIDYYRQNYLDYDPDISFQLETCNTVFCSNQTFPINPRSITKLEAVDDLKLINTSPQGATVAWRQDFYHTYCTYNVEYRLMGTDWRAVNASTLQCEYSESDAIFACELHIALPCPDVHYELRVYVRFKQATIDMYWSEPAALFFFTAPSTGGEVDPACSADFREVTEEPPPSATVVLYRVRQLISDERKETKALKAKLEGLKEKLATVKALMASRTASDVSRSGHEA